MAIQTLAGTRLRGTRGPARSDVRTSSAVIAARSETRTSGAVIAARSDARTSGAVVPARKETILRETPPRSTNQGWLSDVDAWALPFDLACGGSTVPAPRGLRGDTYVVWS